MELIISIVGIAASENHDKIPMILENAGCVTEGGRIFAVTPDDRMLKIRREEKSGTGHRQHEDRELHGL